MPRRLATLADDGYDDRRPTQPPIQFGRQNADRSCGTQIRLFKALDRECRIDAGCPAVGSGANLSFATS